MNEYQVIANHPGIIGDHREEIIDIFLKSILPAKYSVETGILVGVEHQKDYESQQSDIIIWDSFNYPKIKQLRSSLIFAESAKMMIESAPQIAVSAICYKGGNKFPISRPLPGIEIVN